MQFLLNAPRFLFFTGKGGVGKTSIACATAIHLTEGRKRVLLVSTDSSFECWAGFRRENR
jgi:arsenite-transporting ATPase